MKSHASMEDLPKGKYREIATIYLCPEDISQLTGAPFIDTFDDLDYCKQAYFSDENEGLILTSYRGFQEKSCVLASNQNIDDPQQYLLNAPEKIGLDLSVRHALWAKTKFEGKEINP